MFQTQFPAYLKSAEHWRHVTTEMTRFVRPYITPVYEMESSDVGLAWGSGTYITVGAATYLLTNEHVAEKMITKLIAHLPLEGGVAVRVTNPMHAVCWPVDAAMSRVQGTAFDGTPIQGLPVQKLDQSFSPADYELFSTCGYPGYSSPKFATQPNRRTSYFGSLNTPDQPYVSQQVPLPNRPDCRPEFHFAISYPNEGAMASTGGYVDTPDAHGMSGSLVWNTSFVASGGRGWKTDHASVCGIVWGWDPDAQCLVCTKVEFLREAILSCLRHEAAYFKWCDRGRPEDDALTDWLWAEKAIPCL